MIALVRNIGRVAVLALLVLVALSVLAPVAPIVPIVNVSRVFAAATPAQDQKPDDPVARESLKLAEVYRALEQNYVGKGDPDAVILNGGIRSMLSVLDPFSAFFDRDQFESLQQQARGEALGFGSILYVQTGKVLVLQTAQGSPSWRAGLGPGDEIVAVDGTRIAGLDFNSLVQLLQQSRSKPARLGVIHPGKDVSEDVQLRPAEVALPTVDKVFLLDHGVGYIHVSGFESKTPQEIIDAVQKLRSQAGKGDTSNRGKRARGEEQGLAGLILDLRDNHGGLVEAALGVASVFLKPDELVLNIRGRSGAGRAPAKSYKTVPAPFHYNGPLVALVNGETASAAEVVTAALEEHDRALVAGEPTYGKGVVETVEPLSEKMGLALITAQYFTPSGRSIQRPLPGTQLAAAVAQGSPDGPADSAAGSKGAAAFHTDDGRPLQSGGGITPDVLVPPRPLDPWATFLDQRGAFTQFASEYISTHASVTSSFEADAAVMREFRDFLGRLQVRVPEEYWTPDQGYLKMRIKAELFNLVYGLSRGDEVEVRADPQVQKAATLFSELPALLKPARTKSARR
ncbi:MAG TPA: S41 family peptidase [Terriglobia bacterium]|nr:S41 family peptidase [Terriglobia bacterium]